MELVYLYIQEYKNIKNQGFNFSSKYKCKYEKDILTIEENKDYIDNFFGDNINITAIVGENGSGKSSILETILNIEVYAFDDGNRSDGKGLNFIKIFYKSDENKFYIRTTIIDDIGNIHYCDANNNTLDIKEIVNLFFVDYNNGKFNNSVENIKQSILNNNFFYLYTQNFDKPYNENNYGAYSNENNVFTEPNKIAKKVIDFEYTYTMNLSIEQEKIYKKIIKNINFYKDNIIDNFFVPNKIEFIIDVTRINFDKNEENATFEQFLKIFNEESFIYDTSQIKDDILNLNLKYLIHIGKIYDILKDYGIKQDSNLECVKNILKSSDDIRKEYTEKFDSEHDIIINPITYHKSLFLAEFDKIINLFKNIDNVVEDISGISPLKHEKIEEIEETKNIRVIMQEIGDIKNRNLLSELPRYFVPSISLKCGYEYENLSSGQKSIINFIYSIIDLIEKRKECNTKNSIFILLDEIENYIHPNWQKKTIDMLIKAFSETNISLHFIITSHSPFVLSDIPKENVIFLKEGKQEYPFENSNTFGANIHTLLSHGFFMQDGLMGEFAKSKIEEIQDFYNKVVKENDKNKYKTDYQEKNKTFRQIQNIIGEPFLKTIIYNYLNELDSIFLSNDDKKNKIDEEIKKLQQLKESL